MAKRVVIWDVGGKDAYGYFERILMDNWAFDSKGARMFANAIIRGDQKYHSRSLRKLRHVRRDEALEVYRGYGGKSKRPNWTKDALALRAAREVTLQFTKAGYDPQKISDWYFRYYKGFKTKKDANSSREWANAVRKMSLAELSNAFPLTEKTYVGRRR